VRLVLDTSVIVSAIRSKSGASYELVMRALKHEVEFLTSVSLAFEYEDVMLRHQQISSSWMPLSGIEELILALMKESIQIQPVTYSGPGLPDESDEHVLGLAIEGKADAIVTFNRRHFDGIAQSFGVELITPGESLRRLES